MDGEAVNLVGTTELGATAVASGLEWPAMGAGQAFATIGAPGTAIGRVQRPTPREQNLPGGGIEIIPSEEADRFRFAYPTGNPAGTSGWILEMSTSLTPGTWQVIESGAGSGIERVHESAIRPGERRFFRVRLP